MNFFTVDFRERKGKRENIDLLVASYMFPDQRSNPQPWCVQTMLQPTQLPGQGPPDPLSVACCDVVLNFDGSILSSPLK